MTEYSIGAHLFKEMILTSAKFLEQNKQTLNDLNVFPVPDGDTGTNMSLTLLSAAREVNATQSEYVFDMANAVNMGALKGARGNSGVILSQFFRGFAKGIPENKKQITQKDLANAMNEAVSCAYKAVMKPKEGTILTVAKAMAKSATDCLNAGGNLLHMLDSIIEGGQQMLHKTPDMLAVLKEAGVVDAGGAGLLVIFRGFKMAVDGEDVAANLDFSMPVAKKEAISTSDIKFAYCTEFFIKNLFKDITSDMVFTKFREKLMSVGDCVLVVGDVNLVKVHVHTNVPGKVLQLALAMGELSSIKIDNMKEQHTELGEAFPSKKKYALIAVAAGQGLCDIFMDFSVDQVVPGGQSMNPSIEDICACIDKVNAQTVYIFPNNKNIILAAQQAGNLSKQNVVVIPSKTFPQGLNAVLSFDAEADEKQNTEKMIRALGEVKSGQVTYAVRDSNMNGQAIKKDECIGIFESDIVVNNGSLPDTALELLKVMANEQDEGGVISIYYGEDVSEQDAHALAHKIEEQFEDYDIEVYSGGQPVYSYIISVE